MNFFQWDFFFKTRDSLFIMPVLSYLWTTHYTLLPLLLIPMFLLLIFKKNTSLTTFHSLVVFAVFLLMLFNLKAMLFSNEALPSPFDTEHVFNSLLQNHLNFYHPPLFFMSTWFFSSLSFVFQQACFLIFMRCFFYFQVTFVFLGGWWAYQEGTWGGWWNWDASENLSLVFLALLVYLFHVPTNSFLTLINWVIFESSYLFLMFFFMLQLSYSSSSHSFGLEFTFILTKDIFFFMSLFSLSFVLIKNLLHLSRYLGVSYLYEMKHPQMKVLIWFMFAGVFLSLLFARGWVLQLPLTVSSLQSTTLQMATIFLITWWNFENTFSPFRLNLMSLFLFKFYWFFLFLSTLRLNKKKLTHWFFFISIWLITFLSPLSSFLAVAITDHGLPNFYSKGCFNLSWEMSDDLFLTNLVYLFLFNYDVFNVFLTLIALSMAMNKLFK